MPVVQVAMSALDVDVTTTWYREVLGFLPGGELRDAGGPEAAAMQGLPTCRCDMVWLVDTSDFFQLEFFRFHEPEPVPGERRPDDLGWSLLGLQVADLDAVLGRLRGARTGTVLGTAPGRRVCTRDPNGVWLELRERDGQAKHAVREAAVTTAFVRAVVDDLDGTARFFRDVLGLGASRPPLHGPADEALWGAQAAETRTAVLTAPGHPFAVELVEYRTRRPRPLPPGHRICDQGLLNIALGSRAVADYEAVVGRVRRAGYPPHGEMPIGPAKAGYLTGPDALGVELLTIPDPAIERDFGFVPLGHLDRYSR